MYRVLLFSTLVATIFSGPLTAQNPPSVDLVHRLAAADGGISDRFGTVAIDGDTIVVGARNDSAPNFASGSAYVFSRNLGGPEKWGQVVKLVPGDSTSTSRFGQSVAISGDLIVIGSPSDHGPGSFTGSAYVFGRNQGGAENWGLVKKLNAVNAEDAAVFGDAVAIAGDTIIIGAPQDGVTNSGSAYIFGQDHGGPLNWGQIAKLTPPVLAASTNFGDSVGIDGDLVIVGAWGDSQDGTSAGAAYIYGRHEGGTDAWGQIVRLSADNPSNFAFFGRAVDIHETTAIVGSTLLGNVGQAFIFEQDQGGSDNWGLMKMLDPPDLTGGDLFGSAVAIHGELAIVGAEGKDDHADNAGAAYFFHRYEGGEDAWGQIAKVVDPILEEDDVFGFSVASSGNTSVVGARAGDGQANNSGTAHIFELDAARLDIANKVPVVSGSIVEIPVSLSTGGHELTSLAFSLDYDETCLSFDGTDSDVDGIPDDLMIQLSSSFSSVVFLDVGDTDGEIDISLFANDPGPTIFANGDLLIARFTSICTPEPTAPAIAPVLFSMDPSPSSGSVLGHSLATSVVDGSAKVFSGTPGDCNGDSAVDAADITASQLETVDGDGLVWADVDGGTFSGSGVGCDANGDLSVDAGDLSCQARLLFGLVCGGEQISLGNAPRLTIPESFVPSGDIVTVRFRLDPGTALINSLIFSLDYDQERLVFEDRPGDVRFLGQGTLQSHHFDAADTGGEIDLIVADLSSSPNVFIAGDVVEIDLRLLSPSTEPLFGALRFSAELPVSFGNISGQSVPGTGDFDSVLFRDGFESGSTAAWQ